MKEASFETTPQSLTWIKWLVVRSTEQNSQTKTLFHSIIELRIKFVFAVVETAHVLFCVRLYRHRSGHYTGRVIRLRLELELPTEFCMGLEEGSRRLLLT